MSARELILLSPYRLPTHTTLYLADDDVAAFLNGYSALWHPALLAGAAGPPRVGSPYDYMSNSSEGHIYAVPESPPLMLSEDWEQRVGTAGALLFKAAPDRAATFANLMTALRSLGDAAPSAKLLDLDVERLAPFLGVGFGYLQMEGLFEAMSHDNVLDGQAFWQDVSQAVEALSGEDADAPRRHLQAAATRLFEAREVVYQSSIHLVDLAFLKRNWGRSASMADELPPGRAVQRAGIGVRHRRTPGPRETRSSFAEAYGASASPAK